MANDRFQMNRELGRALVNHDVRILERSSWPNPDHAREALKLARLLELIDDDEPSPTVAWLVRYIAPAEAAGSR